MKDMQDLLEQYKTQAELLKTKVALAEKRGGRLGYAVIGSHLPFQFICNTPS